MEAFALSSRRVCTWPALTSMVSNQAGGEKCTAGKLTGELCKSNMCVKELYYPDLGTLAIPDPSDGDFTLASVGDVDVRCLPCPATFTQAGAPCPRERTICAFEPVQDSVKGMKHVQGRRGLCCFCARRTSVAVYNISDW
jgi:hypothetical protein